MILPMVASVCAVASAKTIDVYSVNDVLQASTNTAGGPFELILHADIGVTGDNSSSKWTTTNSLFFKSDYTIKSQSGGDYSISFTNGGKVQLQEVFNNCDNVVFENLHDVTFSGFSDVCAHRDLNTAYGSGYDAEYGAILDVSNITFKNLTGKLTVSKSYFTSGTMAASGLGNADAEAMGIGLFSGTATFSNVAGGIEFSSLGIRDETSTAIDWPRWIIMEGAALLATSVNFSENGGSIVFSGNYVDQTWKDGAEGAGYGAAVSLGGGQSKFSNNAGALLFSGNELHMATVGCAAALYLRGGSDTVITGQHRDEAAGIDASISFTDNRVKINHDDGAKVSKDMYAYGGAVSLGFSYTGSSADARLSITDNDCDVVFRGNYIQIIYTSTDKIDDNHVDAYGGAVYVDSGSTLSISRNQKVEFSNNYIDFDYLDTNTNADAFAYGGALYLDNGAKAEFVDNSGAVIFSDNYVSISGPRVKADAGALMMRDGSSLLLKSDAASHFKWEVSIDTFARCEDECGAFFHNNYVNDGRGGAIFMEGASKITLDTTHGIVFATNKAVDGGAVYVSKGSSIVADSSYGNYMRFSGNEATRGGAIYLEAGAKLNVMQMIFDYNSARQGGGIYLTGSHEWSGDKIVMDFLHNKVIKGSYDASGAGIFLNYNSGLTISGKELLLTFTRNEGCSIFYGSDFTISGSEKGSIVFDFNTNTVEGGAMFGYGILTFADNGADIKFDHNQASSGGAINSGATGESPTLLFQNNRGSITFAYNQATSDETWGGAICASNSLFTENQGSILFDSNSSNNIAGAIYGAQLTFSYNTGDISFIGNSAVNKGSAIYANKVVFERNEKGITFEGNNSTEGSGAIYAYDAQSSQSNGSVTFDGNAGTISFLNNSAKKNGAAIYATELAFSFNDLGIIFENNSSTGSGGAIYTTQATFRYNGADTIFEGNSSAESGGAIYATKESIFELNQNITFNNNSAVYGGALNGATYFGDTFGQISFIGNVATKAEGSAIEHICAGGAIYTVADGDNGYSEFYNNAGSILFSGNRAEHEGALGGAIYADSIEEFSFKMNQKGITFYGNESAGSGGALAINQTTFYMYGNNGLLLFENNVAKENGGAIAAYGKDSRVSFINNGEIIFRGNRAAAGHNIFSEGLVEIRNNDNVLFVGVGGSETDIHLRMAKDADNGQTMMNISAPEGKTITFDHARIFLENSPQNTSATATIMLNETYGGVKQSGSIVFTNGSKATFSKAAVALDYGCLEVHDSSLSAATLSFRRDSQGYMENAKLSVGSVTLYSNSTLTFTGHNTLTGELKLLNGKNELNFCIDESHYMESLNTAVSAAALSAGNFAWMKGISQSYVTLDTSQLIYLESGSYVLMALEEGILANGGQYDVLTLPENVVWIHDNEKDFLVYQHTKMPLDLMWMNSSGSELWNMEDANWVPVGGQRAIQFTPNDNVWFTDACTAPAAVVLSTDVAPASVVVDATRDYTFSGEGSLTGDTSIVKKGSGALVLATENDFTGGVDLQEGTLCLHADRALGEGKLTTAEGTALVVGNGADVALRFAAEDAPLQSDIEVQAGASLSVNGSYQAEHAVALSGEGKLSFSAENGTMALTLPGQYRGELVVDARQAAVTLHTQATGQTGACQVSGALRALAEGASILFDGSVAFMQDAELQLAAGTHFAVESGSDALASLLMSDGSTLHVGANDLEQVAALHLEDVLTAEISASGVYFEGSTTYVQEGAYITLLGDANHLGFEGMGELLLQTNLAYTLGANGHKEFILFDGVESFFASDSFHFTVAGYEGETTYVEHRDGAVYVYVVPEPTTATLSMLALSLLMLRRRRS